MTTSQAQTAINKLRAAGLKRSDFRVRTERRYIGRDDRGKAQYEYGDAVITIYLTSEKLLPYARDLARAGLHVEVLHFDDFDSVRVLDALVCDGAAKHYSWISDDRKAGLWHVDYRDDVFGKSSREFYTHELDESERL